VLKPRYAKLPEDDAGDKIAQKSEKMFPDATVHDFGKVRRGTLAKHAFRIVNTSTVPLRITSVRRGG
jgi:hypothetical protein